MFLTWIFRALFVPLLVLAIITSNCSAADASNTAATELTLVLGMLVSEPMTFAARLVYLWVDVSTPWTSTRSHQGCDLLLEYLEISIS